VAASAQNIVLIGMAGVGKSTVGVLLAKAMLRNFVDTDLVVQSAEGKPLQNIVDEVGKQSFQQIEEQHVLSIQIPGAVIATGGSVVYSDQAMRHLKENATTLFLELPVDQLEQRITDPESRGLAIDKDQTFQELYLERLPLYQQYADHTIDCDGLDHEQVVSKILAQLNN
jgi:shikimate kinase